MRLGVLIGLTGWGLLQGPYLLAFALVFGYFGQRAAEDPAHDPAHDPAPAHDQTPAPRPADAAPVPDAPADEPG